MDGLSRERRNATTIKRKLLTMLLVFAVVATYIPFDRAFAANENGKGHGKQVERTEGKDASKKTQVSKKSEPVKQATDYGKEAKEGRAIKPKPIKERDGKEYATVTFDKYGGVGGPAPIRVEKGTSIGIDNFPETKDFPKRYGYFARFWDLTKRPFNGELLFYFFWDTPVYSDTTVYPASQLLRPAEQSLLGPVLLGIPLGALGASPLAVLDDEVASASKDRKAYV